MNYVKGLLLVVGLVLAGSDGPEFPFINLIGVGCLCVFAALLPRATGPARRADHGAAITTRTVHRGAL